MPSEYGANVFGNEGREDEIKLLSFQHLLDLVIRKCAVHGALRDPLQVVQKLDLRPQRRINDAFEKVFGVFIRFIVVHVDVKFHFHMDNDFSNVGNALQLRRSLS